MTTAYLYLRQSKDVEGTRAAVDRQREDCEALCVRHGWAIGDVYVDNDVSATNGKVRKEYRRLLADIEHGRMERGDVIVAWATDRLLRKITEMEELITLLDRARVSVVTVQAGTVDLSTPDGKTMARFAAVVALGEQEKKAARQRRQQQQAAERGAVPGRRAFGYRQDGSLHPEEAPVVREAFNRLFAGASLVSITAYLNSTGLGSVRGNRWHRKGAAYLLQSSRYAGWRVYRAGTDEELRTRGTWPTIVTDEEHERAVALLTDPLRKPAGHRGTARRWLGAGVFLCGRCAEEGTTDADGQPVTMRTGRRTTGQRTYICRQHEHLSRRADPVDEYVLEVVEARLSRPDVADLLAGASPEVGELRAEAEELRRKIDRAVRDYDDETIDGATLKAVKARRSAELAVIERKLTAAARSSRLAGLAANPDPAAAFRAADLAMQQEVVDALCSVVLLPTPRGASAFRRDSVRIDWR
jgi:site-specific DNA recombinase